MTKIGTLTATISMLSLLLAPAAFAEQPMKPGKSMELTPIQSPDEKVTESMPTQPSEMKGKEVSIFKASEVIGYSVKKVRGDELGKIEDIVVDSRGGRVEYAVLSVGGFGGMGDKLFAIPWDVLRPMPQQQAFNLDASKEQLEKAPGFERVSHKQETGAARTRQKAISPTAQPALIDTYDNIRPACSLLPVSVSLR